MTLQKQFSCILLILTYLIYVIRVFFSLEALAQHKIFWDGAVKKFTWKDFLADNILKYSLAVAILLLNIFFFSSEFEYTGKHFDWFFLSIIIICILWEGVIDSRLKQLIKEKEIEEHCVTAAISDWLKFDIILAVFLSSYMLFSKVSFLENYPFIAANVVFWIHLLFTGREMYKGRALYIEAYSSTQGEVSQ
ncbi:MAG TPA: hypothetical protein ENH85_06065 [Candidatus Scalindua sp.]|nr:hypothetical protein [Candidatus Scalindua sp.]